MTSATLETLWLMTLQDVIDRAAHEVKGALNGVSVNLEAVRSRAARPGADVQSIQGLAASAADQLEALTARTAAVLFLARPPRGEAGNGRGGGAKAVASDAQTDVATTLAHLAALLVPAARSDGGSLNVDGPSSGMPTSAPAMAVKLGLASGLLALTRHGGAGRCQLAKSSRGGRNDPVVRFSHESAVPCSLDDAVAATIAKYNIQIEKSGPDLNLWFPGI